MMPRVFQPDPKQRVFYALGYGGNGVSFSAHAGTATRRAHRRQPAAITATCRSTTRRCRATGLAPFRRVGQALLYRWYYLRDELL